MNIKNSGHSIKQDITDKKVREKNRACKYNMINHNCVSYHLNFIVMENTKYYDFVSDFHLDLNHDTKKMQTNKKTQSNMRC